MREVSACVDVALALEYVKAEPPALRSEMALIVNTLMKVALQ